MLASNLDMGNYKVDKQYKQDGTTCQIHRPISSRILKDLVNQQLALVGGNEACTYGIRGR